MTVVLIIVLVILLLIDIYCVSARASLLNANLARLLAQRERMEARVNLAVTLIHKPQHVRATFRLLQHALYFLAGSILTVLIWLNWPWPQTSDALIFLVVVGCLLLFVLLWFTLTWLLQTLTLRDPERVALRLASSVRLILLMLSPFVLLPLSFSEQVDQDEEMVGNVTEDDLKSLVDASQEDGVLELGERKMIYSIFELGDTLAREIMVPRIDMVAIDINSDLRTAVDTMLEAGYSRMPVYDDNNDNIIGLLYTRDLLQAWRENNLDVPLSNLLRQAYFVPEAKKVDELLTEMQSMRVHMAVVVDEYGGVAGLVTLEDIVEEVVGEIQDEYDDAEEMQYQQVGQGEYIFRARVDMDDFNEIMGSNLPLNDADTIGGLLYSRLGHVPVEGESLEVNGVVLTVELVSARRIRKVRATWKPVEANTDDKDSTDQ